MWKFFAFVFIPFVANAGNQSESFIASGIGGAIPGERAFVQLYNPLHSTRNIQLEKISVSWTEACITPCAIPTSQDEFANWFIKREGPSYWDQLGADLRKSVYPYGTLGSLPVSKDFSSAIQSAAQIRVGSSSKDSIPGFSKPFFEIWTSRQTRDFVFDPPILLPPGTGIVAATAKPDSLEEPTVWYIVDWQWSEVDIKSK